MLNMHKQQVTGITIKYKKNAILSVDILQKQVYNNIIVGGVSIVGNVQINNL